MTVARSIVCPSDRRASQIERVEALLRIADASTSAVSGSSSSRIKRPNRQESPPYLDSRASKASFSKVSPSVAVRHCCVTEATIVATAHVSIVGHCSGSCWHFEKGGAMSNDLSGKQVREALASAAGVELENPVVERLMKALDTTKLFRYHKDEAVSFLSTTGRVLIAVLEDPTLTQRAISVYLGCSETLVDKTIKALVDAGVITKTKVNRKNIYAVNVEAVKNHSDIQHLFGVIDALREHNSQPKPQVKRPSPVVDDEPF